MGPRCRVSSPRRRTRVDRTTRRRRFRHRKWRSRPRPTGDPGPPTFALSCQQSGRRTVAVDLLLAVGRDRLAPSGPADREAGRPRSRRRPDRGYRVAPPLSRSCSSGGRHDRGSGTRSAAGLPRARRLRGSAPTAATRRAGLAGAIVSVESHLGPAGSPQRRRAGTWFVLPVELGVAYAARGRPARRRCGTGRAGGGRAAAAGARGRAGRAVADRPRDARRGGHQVSPDRAAGRRDRVARRRSPDQVRAAADHVRTAARSALEELRQLLGLLREDRTRTRRLAPQPGWATRGAGRRLPRRRVRVEVTLTRVRRTTLPAAVGRTAYRVVQEALTNASKHAPGGPVTVTLDCGRPELAVTVTNRAATRAAGRAAQRRRLGPVGLGERVRRWAAAAGETAPRRRRSGSRRCCRWGRHDDPGAARRRRGAGPGRPAHDPGRPPDLEVVGEAGDGAEAVALAARAAPGRGADGHPDAAAGRPGRHPDDPGPAATRRRSSCSPRSTPTSTWCGALRAGASGFLLKDTPPRRDRRRRPRRRRRVTAMLSPAVTRRLIAEFVRGRRATPAGRRACDRLAPLTAARARGAGRWSAAGCPTPRSAKAVHHERGDREDDVSRMLTKLGLANRTQAAILAHEAGLLDED